MTERGAMGADAADIALPRPPGVLQRWLDRHPRLVDWAIAVACQAPLVVIGVVLPATGFSVRSVVWTLFSALIGFVALLFRRRFPLTGTLALSALLPLGALLPFDAVVGGWIDLFVMLYSLGVHSSTRRMWVGYACAAGGALLSGVVQQFAGSEDGAVGNFAPSVIFYLVPTLLGLSAGTRRRYVQAIIDRAKDLARERDQRAQLAVTEERARVAREMHDIVSHGLTVMVTLSEGAAAQADAGAATAPAAMRKVADAGRESLAEMRRLLGVLRAPDAPVELAPQPGSEDLDALIERFRDAGLPVRWTKHGPAMDAQFEHRGAVSDAAHDTTPPPGTTDNGAQSESNRLGADPVLYRSGQGIPLAAYRIVQEALTNVLRHSPRTDRVEVLLDNRVDEVVIDIENAAASFDGHTRSAPPEEAENATQAERASGGRGLIGVRERAALLGGRAEAGPTPEGGWRVHAVLRKD